MSAKRKLKTDREAHLELLADAFFEHLERGWCVSNSWWRPGDTEILTILGVSPDPGGDGYSYTVSQCDYARELLTDGLSEYLAKRWKALKDIELTWRSELGE